MAETDKNIKEEFGELVENRTKVSYDRLKNGIGKLLKQFKEACADQKSKNETVETMLQNAAYLKALDDAENAKWTVSILQWKIGRAKEELVKRTLEINEQDGEF